MKNLITFALLLCAATAFAQKDTTGLNIPLVNQAVVYEKIYDVPNLPQKLLYSNARTWFASTHPDAGKTQPTLRDSILSRITGKATFSANSSTHVMLQKWTFRGH